MTSETQNTPSNSKLILAISLLAMIAPASAVLSPLIVGLYVTDLGFSPQQGGKLIAAELIGAGLSSLSTYFLISRLSWHKILFATIFIMIGCYLLSAMLSSYEALRAVRFVSGLALGTMMTMTIIVAGMTRNPERAFGFWSLSQIIFAVVGFALFPQILPTIGLDGFFIFMAIAIACLTFPSRMMPEKSLKQSKETTEAISSKIKWVIAAGALSLFLFYTGIGSVWAYVERIASQAGFEPGAVGYVLSVSSLMGVAGAMAVTWLSTRFGSLLPSLVGYVLLGLGMGLLLDLQAMLFYTIASLLFKFSWWFVAPYLLAAVTGLDASGKVAILVNFVIASGLGFGHGAGAMALDVGQRITGDELNYNVVVIFGLLCLVISFALLLIVFHNNKNTTFAEMPSKKLVESIG